jgi:hypothetical protein
MRVAACFEGSHPILTHRAKIPLELDHVQWGGASLRRVAMLRPGLAAIAEGRVIQGSATYRHPAFGVTTARPGRSMAPSPTESRPHLTQK